MKTIKSFPKIIIDYLIRFIVSNWNNFKPKKKVTEQQLQYQRRSSKKPTKEEVDYFCEFLDKHFSTFEKEISGEEIGQERFEQSSNAN